MVCVQHYVDLACADIFDWLAARGIEFADVVPCP